MIWFLDILYLFTYLFANAMLNVSVCVGVCMFVCQIIFQIKYDVKGVCECASVVFRHDKTSSYDDVNLWLVATKVLKYQWMTSFKCQKLDPIHESNEFWEIVQNSCVEVEVYHQLYQHNWIGYCWLLIHWHNYCTLYYCTLHIYFLFS